MKKNLAMVGANKDESLLIAKRIVQACEDVKGNEVVVLDVASIADFADYFIVASGRSDRQVQGITNRVIEELSKLGVRPLSVEGYEDGQWVLIDCGDVVLDWLEGHSSEMNWRNSVVRMVRITMMCSITSSLYC